MDPRNPQQRTFILLVGAVYLLVLVVAAGFLWQGEYLYAFDITIVGILLPTTVFVLLFKKQLSANSPWQRVVPRVPLELTARDEMSRLLEDIRQSSANFLRPSLGELQDKQVRVRANVFLADYTQPRDGIAFELFMPSELRKNMNYPPEWQLRFNPGQGATGCVFIEGDQRVTRRLPTDDGEWESVFKMSDELKEKVHKDLKWIVSLPLKDPASQSTLAVLNIDGLDYDFSDEQLAEMVTNVSKDFLGLAVLMGRQPRVNLSIRVEED